MLVGLVLDVSLLKSSGYQVVEVEGNGEVDEIKKST